MIGEGGGGLNNPHYKLLTLSRARIMRATITGLAFQTFYY